MKFKVLPQPNSHIEFQAIFGLQILCCRLITLSGFSHQGGLVLDPLISHINEHPERVVVIKRRSDSGYFRGGSIE